MNIFFAFCSLPQFLLPPHLGLQAFSSLFLSCSAAGHIPFLPHLAPRGKDWKAKQKNYSLGNYNWHNPAAPKLPLKVREERKPLPCSDQEKPEEGSEGFEAKVEAFDGSKNAVREAPRRPSSGEPESLIASLAEQAPTLLCTAQGSHRNHPS